MPSGYGLRFCSYAEHQRKSSQIEQWSGFWYRTSMFCDKKPWKPKRLTTLSKNCGSVPCGSLTQHFGKVGQGKGYTKTIVKSHTKAFIFNQSENETNLWFSRFSWLINRLHNNKALRQALVNGNSQDQKSGFTPVMQEAMFKAEWKGNWGFSQSGLKVIGDSRGSFFHKKEVFLIHPVGA